MKGPNQLDVKRDDVNVGRERPPRGDAGHAHRGGPSSQRPRRRPVHRVVAARRRLRADLQPDGRRRDRRDLARAGLAVDQAPGEARRRLDRLARALPHRRRRGDGPRPRPRSATSASPPASSRRRASSSSASLSHLASRSSSPSRRTSWSLSTRNDAPHSSSAANTGDTRHERSTRRRFFGHLADRPSGGRGA